MSMLDIPRNEKLTDRTFGLDACRSIAALLVVIGHMLQHSSPHPLLTSMGYLGLFGVDLFFCLSGFLIGRILLSASDDWHVERQKGLLQFWFRRWMRTLPLYYFYLIVSLKFDWKGEASIFDHLSYLGFAQNFAWKMPDFYGLTWSLAVEEWFYFSFPLILLLLIGLRLTARQAAAATTAIFVILPPTFRLLLPETYQYGSFDEGHRHIAVFRLDAIGYGVALAYIFRWHKELFLSLSKFWWIFLAIVIACATYTKLGYIGLSSSKLLSPIYLSISALGFAGLLPVFYKMNQTRSALINRFIKYTSLISYSMYLGHIFAFMIVISTLKRLNIFDAIYPNPWLVYPVFFACVYSLSTLTYFFVEKPLLKLRDRASQDVLPNNISIQN